MPDAPDWITDVQVNVVVQNVPVPSQPSKEVAAGNVGRYSGILAAWQKVAEWTVADEKTGELKEVSMITNDYVNTVWKLTVGIKEVFTNLTIQSALTLPFFDLKLASLTVVTLSCGSVGAAPIVADGSIIGKEIG